MLDKFGLVSTKIKAVKAGETYGRLLIEAVGQIHGTYRYYAICKCSCGSKLKKIRIDGLISGQVVSCGCFHKEKTTIHGMTSSTHYDRWRGMMDRCYNKDCKSYNDYGGRGIKVFEEWHNVCSFISDLPKGYSSGLEIDRIDNNGNYEPENIRWSTKRDNCKNRRSTRIIELNGEKKCLSDWAKSLNINITTLSERLEKWSLKDALTLPKGTRLHNRWDGHAKAKQKPKRELKLYKYKNQLHTMKELSKLSGVPSKKLRKRINERKWSIEKAVTT